ncbi:MAG TPA: NADPH-dependent FMN reductase [Xanthobacteraceae bacterium]|nr:NADPH-dependent FMN reductase [Xanthobacteraceae bacterium]
MADKLNVITIVGSLRKGSYNAALARQLPKWQPDGMSITASPSWAGFPVYNADDQNTSGFPKDVEVLADAIRKADGVIFVTPEYNYGIPGGLKNAIDWLSRLKDQPFVNKPVAIQSCTGGPLGGGRMQYQLRQAFVFLDALAFNKPEIFVGMAQTKFDAQTLEFKDEAGINFIKQQLAGFEKFIRKVSGK